MTGPRPSRPVPPAAAEDERLREVWDLLGNLEHSPVVAEARAATWRLAGRRRPWLSGGWQRMAAATVAAGVACVGGFLLWPSAVERTDIGEIRRVTLADGTLVTLDTATRLAVRFTNETRDVELSEGQAYFVVAHDAVHPFRVFTPLGEVRAVGTEFDVRVDSAVTTVTLVQGSVKVHGGGADVAMAPGDQVALEAEKPPLPVQGQAHLAAVTAWRQATIDLDNVTLRQAVAEVNRYSKDKVRIGDPALMERRISGVFRTGDPKGFVRAAEAYFDVRNLGPNGGMTIGGN